MLQVTKAFLPPLEDYVKYLERVWNSHNLTNGGPLVQEFESRLRERLGVKHFFFTSNGTIALQIAIKALGIKKEVITTPFSYVATCNSIIWENCKPVFVDIDPENFSIHPSAIEAAITPNTEAIMAVHVYGFPGNLKKIEEIAKKNHLHVIYDGAHALGVEVEGKSVFGFGDISTLSFHATKLIHTGEGGAIITNDDELAKKISLFRSFGHLGDDFFCAGVNGKNSELHGAMGLCNLDHLDAVIKRRREASEIYDRLLSDVAVILPQPSPGVTHNFSYYPVLFRTEKELLKAKANLAEKEIFARRYFYPSLNTLPFLKGASCPISEDISLRALCLPISFYITAQEQEFIAGLIKSALQS